jgi:alpha-glucan,water dikinase
MKEARLRTLTGPLPAPGTSTEESVASEIRDAAITEGVLSVHTLWLRFTAARLLVWNHNYNVKPREVSAAQRRLASALSDMWLRHPWTRGLAAVALGAVGRGGDGDMGQRIRDEILAIQHKSGAKGGMMEQWHQKLHNNTSPDDVVICQALLAYVDGCAYALLCSTVARCWG